MLPRLLFALGLVLSGTIATTGMAYAEFNPDREELMAITAAAFGIVLGFLTLVYAIKWYFGLDQQPPTDLPDPHAEHH